MMTALVVLYAVFRIGYAIYSGKTTSSSDYRGRDEPGGF